MLTAFPQGTLSLNVKLPLGQRVGSCYKNFGYQVHLHRRRNFYTLVAAATPFGSACPCSFNQMLLVSRVSARPEVDVGIDLAQRER